MVCLLLLIVPAAKRVWLIIDEQSDCYLTLQLHRMMSASILLRNNRTQSFEMPPRRYYAGVGLAVASSLLLISYKPVREWLSEFEIELKRPGNDSGRSHFRVGPRERDRSPDRREHRSRRDDASGSERSREQRENQAERNDSRGRPRIREHGEHRGRRHQRRHDHDAEIWLGV